MRASSVEIGHHHVERDRDRPQLLGELEPLQTSCCCHHRKAFALEVLGNELARGGIVVDDKHAISPLRQGIGRAGCAGGATSWQAHGEDRALAGLALHVNVTAHHARELAGDGKA